ncbi:MAG: imidazole glycerol phosphate synthase subunit HisH [Ilumatobacteraceae bacterium]|nr:imidazole glycerol phosphate synthase subunit HisH [Ilumatobacteraceae bacterium]
MSTPLIAVLDYGIGNLRSAQKALQKVGADARLTNDAALIRDAQAAVLPGVGNFGACMNAVRAAGLEDLVLERVAGAAPFLGICVGMQMLFSESEESPGVAGFNVVPGVVRYLPDTVKRPQMQWNRLQLRTNPQSVVDPLFATLPSEPWMYFVHSLHGVPTDASCIVATADYGCDVTAAVRINNVFAVQFHPEKSAVDGLGLLRNFVDAARLVAA